MQRLPESELDIMLALWDADNPSVPRAYFDEKLSYKGWSVNALNSFLSRLEDRGFLQSAREGRNKYYTAVVKREDYLNREGRSFLQKLYKGSLKNFLLSLTERGGLEEAEIDDLRQYLNELKEGKTDDR